LVGEFELGEKECCRDIERSALTFLVSWFDLR
jgi:hypothetical protein